jgi:nucleoside-diphosphate-sugar epimerase
LVLELRQRSYACSQHPASNSACDVAVKAARVAETVCLSMRISQWFFPKFVFGLRARRLRAVAAYLKETRGLDYLDIPSNYHSNWMDNSRAKFELEWRPRYDLVRLIDAAWTYRRAPGDSRKVWYPG